ncbi:transglycosylase domain-containing protein [Robertmurraya massiliosenegalensis]|uniref:transglycosylase domain-containing protein n=1 Tax=Robertmurraya massiliosenegalensis TaxID=1287657 RepID=UPI0002DEE3BC|nr:PBP1A family penicillin-binding protein [Robertmurraya massiliosenegalensis]
MAEKYQSREERRKQVSQQKGKGNKKVKLSIKRIFLFLVALGIAGLLIGAGTFAYMVKDTPELDEKLLKDPISSELYDINGELFAEIGSEKRDYVNYEDIPKQVEEAILATEDTRFYKHNGIDLIRLGGAVVANITEGFGAEGASTITQQVVKNSFLTPEKTLSRKAQEAWLSFQLERKYTKQQIFEMYVNKIWMDSGGHGVATAAKVFYGKELDQLTLAETALLAGMPQSPANYNPFKNPDKAEKRRNIVLTLMHKHGFITQEEMEEAKNVDVASTLVPEDERPTGDIPYDAFVGHVVKEIKAKYPDLDPFSDGLKIYTTLEPDAQKYVEDILNGDEIIEYPDEKFQAGISLLDTATGQIRALGGGRNQTVDFGFNYATDAKRQPGSTIKPVLDYGPAIEYLKWGTYHTLDDKPYTYSTGDKISNWDNKHMGVMTMRTALALSRNIPALQAFQEVGEEKAKQFAISLGIPLKEIHESYSIGGFGGEDKGVSSLEMAGAYSAFGNNGFYTEPYSVIEIQLRDDTKLNMKPESKVVMQDYTAFMISDMLKDVVRTGTGTRANISGLPLAGKSGTTNYPDADKKKYNIPNGAVPDAWFVGYTTNYTAAVWTGYDNKNENYLEGDEQKIGQRLFKNIMEHVHNGKETQDFKVPNTVEKVQIEKGTIPAKLASEYTPSDMVITEYAVKGNAPKEVSEKYNKLETPVDLKADYDTERNEIVLSWNYVAENANGVQFEIYAKKDDGAEELLTAQAEKTLRMKADYGGYYTFKVVAIRDEQKSDPATAEIQIPDPFIFDGEDDEEDNGNNNGHGPPWGRDDDDEEENDQDNEDQGNEDQGQGENPDGGEQQGGNQDQGQGNQNGGNQGNQP